MNVYVNLLISDFLINKTEKILYRRLQDWIPTVPNFRIDTKFHSDLRRKKPKHVEGRQILKIYYKNGSRDLYLL